MPKLESLGTFCYSYLVITPDEKPNKEFAKRQLISIAFQLGFIIAIPVVLFGFVGKWLDARTGTYPLLTLIGIFAAIVSTSVWIYRKFRSYFKQ